MRIATWAIQDQHQLLVLAAGRVSDQLHDAAIGGLDVVFRSFVARLSGAQLHPSSVRAAREEHQHLGVIARIVADVLTAHATKRSDGGQGEEHAISTALTDVLAAFDPDGDSADVVLVGGHEAGRGDSANLSPTLLPEPFDAPRPTLVFALNEFARQPVSSTEQPRPARALLRLRATTVQCARALRRCGDDPQMLAGTTREAAAPDELCISTDVDGAGGVLRLVRVTTAIATALAADYADVAGAIVRVHTDVLSAAIEASAMARVGVVVFDDDGFALVRDELARVPGDVIAIDPRAPRRADRMELSAMLARAPFIGRGEGVARLAQWMLAPTAQAGLMLLHGAHGIGKASLVRRALLDAGYDDLHAPVAWGWTDELAHTPYAAWLAMVRGLCGTSPLSADAVERHGQLLFDLSVTLQPRSAEELRAASPTLHALLGTAVLADQHATPCAARNLARRCLCLLSEALWHRGGAARPLVLVVANAQALDRPSLDVFALCANELQGRLRVVMLSTTKLRIAPRLARAFVARHEQLSGLTATEVNQLVRATLGAPDAPDGLPRFDKARGNPLHVVQSLRSAVESGALRQGATQQGVEPLRAVLASRVSRLGVGVQEVLAACALVGPVVTARCAEFVGVRLGRTHHEVRSALALLCETGFLSHRQRRAGQPEASGAEVQLCFEHPLVRDVASESYDAARRAVLHDAIAQATVELAPLQSPALSSALARHALEGSRPDSALAHLLDAAQFCSAFHDVEAATRFASIGLSLQPRAPSHPVTSFVDAAGGHELTTSSRDPPRSVFELIVHTASSLDHTRAAQPTTLGLQDRRAALMMMLRAADETADPRARARALLIVARFNLSVCDSQAAQQACTKAALELRGLGETKLELTIARVSALASVALGELAQAQLVVDVLRDLGSTEARSKASIEHMQGRIHHANGAFADAVEAHARGVLRARACADRAAEAACYEALAEPLLRAATTPHQVRAGHVLLQRAFHAVQRAGDGGGATRLQMTMAQHALCSGNTDEAVAAGERARQHAQDEGDDVAALRAVLAIASAYLIAGDVFVAEPMLEAAKKRCANGALLGGILGALALIKVMRARVATGGARDRLLKAAARRAHEAFAATASGPPWSTLAAGIALGEALLDGGDAGAGFAQAQRAHEILQEAQTPWVDHINALHLRALVAVGDDEEYHEILRRAQHDIDRRALLIGDGAGRFLAAPVRVHLMALVSRSAAPS